MKLIILKFHIFYTYFTIKKIIEVNKKQNKNLKQIRIIYNLTWEALKTKQKQLKLQDKGNKPKRACPPTDEEINILYNRNVLGSHTPQSLLNTLIWLNNPVQFEHQTLRLLHIFYYKISSY
jgi:hypothetical protein